MVVDDGNDIAGRGAGNFESPCRLLWRRTKESLKSTLLAYDILMRVGDNA